MQQPTAKCLLKGMQRSNYMKNEGKVWADFAEIMIKKDNFHIGHATVTFWSAHPRLYKQGLRTSLEKEKGGGEQEEKM